MWMGMLREFRYLIQHKWDLCMVTLAPALIILLFSSMFSQGKPEHLAIAIIDQDQSSLSQNIIRFTELNHGLNVKAITTNVNEAEQLINQTKVWGYIHIPAGAEQRLVQAKDAQISIAYNQSYFSVGNSISSAMLLSTLQAMADFTGNHYFENNIPYLDAPTPNVKISPLYNPGLNYEFYLEPYMIPAILHLLLCCCVAFSVGQEIKAGKLQNWTQTQSLSRALISKNLSYVLIFSLWTWAWMFWLIEFRGWFIQGSLWIILLGQLFFYSSYAFISSTVVLATKDLAKSFGFIAVYGGSSLSFAGVTLPLNNAPMFTKFWANIIPYTPYAKLQTEQWVIGSPLNISITPLITLMIYCTFYFGLAWFFLRKITKEAVQ
ncbi:ABC transporter permease [Acinetobacter gandensis]|uniref:Multidrug ABC transporter permease n=1 Tax=Acinetobacter gandensis TaxID=1443941 RepID=A0A1A7R8F5_9GAMM|nr:ABC transporter permease [Acinetobacter gandensis]KAB0626602.1 ABC transporter permease [Acinetobacter gandensis]OBX28181.1 multidrug ABC transporter permease [Acinetobacter gandensis]